MSTLSEDLLRGWKDVIYTHFPKLKLTPPVFMLTESKHILGEWSGYPINTISINVRLLNKPWYVIEDILRHEIAHQLKDVFFPQVQEPPHGPCFRDICKQISADPRAVVEEVDLEERIFNPTARQDDAILSKIKKLLNLGNAATDNEAQVALCKAHELMLKHGVEQAQLQSEEIVTINLQPAMKRRTAGWQYLAALLTEFWPVYGIWCQIPWDDCGWGFFISGTPHDVRIAAYIWDFIKNRVQIEFKMRFQYLGLLKRDLDNFMCGTVCGIREALRQQTQHSQEEGLILAQSPELSQYVKRRYPHVHNRRTSTGSQDIHGAYAQGKEMGRNLHLNSGIEQKDTKLLK